MFETSAYIFNNVFQHISIILFSICTIIVVFFFFLTNEVGVTAQGQRSYALADVFGYYRVLVACVFYLNLNAVTSLATWKVQGRVHIFVCCLLVGEKEPKFQHFLSNFHSVYSCNHIWSLILSNQLPPSPIPYVHILTHVGV